MSRRADALKRDNRQTESTPAPNPAVVVAGQLSRAEPRLRAVSTRHAYTPAPFPTDGLTLIGLPQSDEEVTAWRTDPELVGKLVGTDGFSAAAMEQYRKLAATLHHAQGERAIKIIMTSSAQPGEGKSLTSVNLALT